MWYSGIQTLDNSRGFEKHKHGMTDQGYKQIITD